VEAVLLGEGLDGVEQRVAAFDRVEGVAPGEGKAHEVVDGLLLEVLLEIDHLPEVLVDVQLALAKGLREDVTHT
jgi:hypothetical protein